MRTWDVVMQMVAGGATCGRFPSGLSPRPLGLRLFHGFYIGSEVAVLVNDPLPERPASGRRHRRRRP